MALHAEEITDFPIDEEKDTFTQIKEEFMRMKNGYEESKWKIDLLNKKLEEDINYPEWSDFFHAFDAIFSSM